MLGDNRRHSNPTGLRRSDDKQTKEHQGPYKDLLDTKSECHSARIKWEIKVVHEAEEIISRFSCTIWT